MIQKHLAVISLYFIVVMLVLHLAATAFYWYVSVPWYDMLMHTLGGIFLAIFTTALFARYIMVLDRYETFVTLLLAVLIVGGLWEYFEYAMQYFVRGSAELANIPDSIVDLVCDMLGGIAGIIFVLRLKKRYTAPNA